MFTTEELEQMAIISIRNYLNKPSLTDVDIKDQFPLAIKKIVSNIGQVDKRNGVKSVTQGARAVTYNDSQTYITDDVRLLLPKPFIKML